MASIDSIPLTPREALSGICGDISLTCWIFLLLPQLIENYRNGSADGISLAFLFIWFVGDVTNLAGALWAKLVPTVIAIAVYFCFADGILIGQCLYYRFINRKEAVTSTNVSPPPASAETEPLLHRRESSSMTIPGSRRRSSTASKHRRDSLQPPALASVLEEEERNPFWRNTLSIIGIVAVGVAGWAIAWAGRAWTPSPVNDEGETEMALGAEILGYFSAVCYLGARIPQIIKNWKEKSCEGECCFLFLVHALLMQLARIIFTFLHLVTVGQPDIWWRDLVSFYRKGILHDELAMVDW